MRNTGEAYLLYVFDMLKKQLMVQLLGILLKKRFWVKAKEVIVEGIVVIPVVDCKCM